MGGHENSASFDAENKKELICGGDEGLLGALRLLEAARRVKHGAVEEMVDHAEHVVFRKNFYLETGPGFPIEKVPEIVFGQNNGPQEFAQRNSLPVTPSANFGILVFDIPFRTGGEPLA